MDDGRDNAKYGTATGTASLGITGENENRTSLRGSLDPDGLSAFEAINIPCARQGEAGVSWKGGSE